MNFRQNFNSPPSRWYYEDLGMKHEYVYLKPQSLHLNGKVKRSHKTDVQAFYQLIDYTDDIDIRNKLQEWEMFYNRQSHCVSNPILH